MEIEFEALHPLSLAFVAVVIILADSDGVAYLRGKKETLKAGKVRLLHNLAWVGLGLMAVTGIGLIAEHPDVVTESAFMVKMLMVLALFVNGFVIGQLAKLSTATPFRLLSPRQKMMILASGAVSISCWIGAAMIGFLI